MLFFPALSKTICSREAGQEVCKQFRCPSCYTLTGKTSCGETQPLPMQICENYVPARISAHAACMLRPLSVCRAFGSNSISDLVRGACDSESVKVTVLPNQTHPLTGEIVSTACTEFSPSIRQTGVQAMLAAACTIPVVGILGFLLNTLRVPVDRAIAGETQQNRRCCGPFTHDVIQLHVLCLQT